MPKINVYVPDDLLLRVRSAEIGVSGVCQVALEAEVRHRELVAGVDRGLTAVAARLVATRAAAEQRNHDDGLALGVRWARDVATLDELETAARAAKRGQQVAYRMLPTLISALIEAEVDPDDLLEEWLDGETSSFDRGILDGAAQVYGAVEPLLAGRNTRTELIRRAGVTDNQPKALEAKGKGSRHG